MTINIILLHEESHSGVVLENIPDDHQLHNEIVELYDGGKNGKFIGCIEFNKILKKSQESQYLENVKPWTYEGTAMEN